MTEDEKRVIVGIIHSHGVESLFPVIAEHIDRCAKLFKYTNGEKLQCRDSYLRDLKSAIDRRI